MKAVIISHGDKYSGSALVRECEDSDIILCADGGAEYAYLNKITPDFLIGDFDSIETSVLDYFLSKGSKILKFPIDKDFTDTELCIEKAIELGCNKICILYGIGNRIDHSLGNIGLLSRINKNNIFGYIACDNCYIYLCNSNISISGNSGDIISIVPFKGDAQGLISHGLKYSLDNLNIEFGRAIGVSNIMTDNICSISIDSGEVLIIKQKI